MNESVLTSLLAKCKVALRVTTTAYDGEIEDLIKAGYDDLVMVNAIQDDEAEDYPLNNPLIVRALVTYTKAYFGAPDNYDELRRAYDALKAQLKTATGYTDWEG